MGARVCASPFEAGADVVVGLDEVVSISGDVVARVSTVVVLSPQAANPPNEKRIIKTRATLLNFTYITPSTNPKF